MKLVLASLLGLATLGLAVRSSDPALDAYTAKLQSAKSLTVEYNLVGTDGRVKCKLEYSSPNRLRIETPDKLSVSDGTTLWILDKTANTYTEAAASTAPATDDTVYAWKGFFVKTPFGDVSDVASGEKRAAGGVQVTPYSLTLPNGKKATLLIDDTGMARGAIVKTDSKNITSLATKVTLGDSTLPDATFTFTPPDGAKKIEAPKPGSATFAAAEAVLAQYCTGCHGANAKRGGVDLSSYASVMAGRRGSPIVVAGDPANSRLIQVISGSTKKMPPGDDAVSADGVKAISDWIQAGAKSDN